MAADLPFASWPSLLREKPILLEVNQPIWEGFWFLSDGRTQGVSGSDPIRLGDMIDYLDFQEITGPDDRKDFVWFIRRMDRVLLDHINEKREQETSKAKASPTGKQLRK